MDDVIYRQAAIEAVGYYSLHSGDKLLFADNALKELPSAQTERKKGHWIRVAPRYYKCSECGVRANSSFANFCHRCGSDMRGENDEQIR